MAATGLKATQYSLLSQVVQLGPIRPSDLARCMGMDASTLTRNLQPLVAQAWLQQGPGHDGRSRLIEATAEGRVKQAEAQRAWKQAQRSLNARLGERNVALLHARIDDCVERLSDEAAEAEENET
jgi:DNA-binding MarR family transcriptional regulator